MDRIADAFAWPVRDPGWFKKVLVIGLILIVPIAGLINGLGWMLTAIDRLRAGEERLPPANFSHIGRGLNLFLVNVVYALALTVVLVGLYVPVIEIYSAEGKGTASAALFGVAVVLNLLLFAVAALGALALNFAFPAIVLGTEAHGISGGLDLRQVLRLVRKSPINTLIAGLMLIAVGFVAQLGLVVCVVGVLFTSAYALAMQAWIVRSYELGST